MAEFKVTPNVLKEHSSKFTNYNRDFSALMDNINNDMTSMKANWEGLASESFYKKFQEMRNGFFPTLNQTINEYAKYLTTAAGTYESTESTTKSQGESLKSK